MGVGGGGGEGMLAAALLSAESVPLSSALPLSPCQSPGRQRLTGRETCYTNRQEDGKAEAEGD